jgi:hypothetical protein
MIFVRVKLTLEIDDDTGSGLFRAFDHVMLTVAVVNSTSQVHYKKIRTSRRLKLHFATVESVTITHLRRLSNR